MLGDRASETGTLDDKKNTNKINGLKKRSMISVYLQDAENIDQKNKVTDIGVLKKPNDFRVLKNFNDINGLKKPNDISGHGS